MKNEIFIKLDNKDFGLPDVMYVKDYNGVYERCKLLWIRIKKHCSSREVEFQCCYREESRKGNVFPEGIYFELNDIEIWYPKTCMKSILMKLENEMNQDGNKTPNDITRATRIYNETLERFIGYGYEKTN